MILKRGDKIHLACTLTRPEDLYETKKFFTDLYAAQGVDIVGITFRYGVEQAAPQVVAVFRD